ncbi:hypothetical protein PR202_ga24599 [Eleusine coracana subsp. coracana]|uniref:F-box domain-containing protein n=1 Tax=Eleusine coracana subsp. coracana TaxID=191504 RepID=A0AAV5D9A8_ELECO|nr:hypothetical protein PR202_ga24599 [Eleusine coracana subsp. coracana]
MATGSGDRISALPDDILHLLLSRLPSDEEVRTCVLARRWRHLWKSTRAIRITNRPWTAEKLHNFVNHLLLLRGGTPADVCSLKCGHLRDLSSSGIEGSGHDFFQNIHLSRIYSPTAPIIEKMPLLVEADVRLEDNFTDQYRNGDYYGDCKDDKCLGCLGSSDGSSMLLEDLSGAKYLELTSDPRLYIFTRDCKFSTVFSSLKTLVLNDWCMGAEFGGLECFLRYSPVLKKLTLQLEYSENPGVKGIFGCGIWGKGQLSK